MDPFSIFDELIDEEKDSNIKREENKCIHKNIVTENGITTCIDCGIEMKIDIVKNGGGESLNVPLSNRVKGVYNELKELGFTEPILSETNNIYQHVTNGSTKRANKRKAILLAAVYRAHEIHNIPVNIERLISLFSLDRQNVNIGIKLVGLKMKDYDHKREYNSYITPIDFIREILSSWETDEDDYKKICDLYNIIEKEAILVNKSRPKSIAAGLIYYYSLKNFKKNINLKDFSKKCNLAEPTITKITKEISSIIESI